MPLDNSGQRLGKQRLLAIGRILLGVAFSLGLGWLVIRGLDWALVGRSLQGFPVSFALLALAVFLLSNVVRAYRWQVLFVNDRISVPRLFLVQNMGLGLNNLVPFRVVSEATQFTILTVRDRINGATALATLGMERVLDVVASTLILLLAFALIPEMKSFAVYIWGVIGFTVVVVALVRFVAWSSSGVTFIRRLPFLASFATAVALLERRRGRLAYSLALSIFFWTLVGISAWIVALGMNLPINAATAIVVVMGTTFFATSVPAMPAAIGTFEAATVYILSFFGIEKEVSFGFAVIVHVLLFAPPTLMAFIFLPREGIGSFRQVQAVAARFSGMSRRPSS